MFAIFAAMKKEAEPIRQGSSLLSSSSLGYAEIEERSVGGKPFLLVCFGIGKAFAAGAMGAIATKYPSLEGVINVGVSGSLQPNKAPLLSPVIATSFVEHDLDTSAIGDPVGLVSGINMIRFLSDERLMAKLEKATESAGCNAILGPISSGDVFYKEKEPRDKIVARFHSLCVDMESGGLAQIAYVNKIPFVALRVISDADNPSDEYQSNAEKASEIAGKVILEFLKQ